MLGKVHWKMWAPNDVISLFTCMNCIVRALLPTPPPPTTTILCVWILFTAPTPPAILHSTGFFLLPNQVRQVTELVCCCCRHWIHENLLMRPFHWKDRENSTSFIRFCHPLSRSRVTSVKTGMWRWHEFEMSMFGNLFVSTAVSLITNRNTTVLLT